MSLGPIEILLFVVAVGVLGLVANELDRLRERGEGVYRPPRSPRSPRSPRPSRTDTSQGTQGIQGTQGTHEHESRDPGEEAAS